MNYDFEDSETLHKVDALIKKGVGNLDESELDMYVEYRTYVKARELVETEYKDKLAQVDAKSCELTEKIAQASADAFEAHQAKVKAIAAIADANDSEV